MKLFQGFVIPRRTIEAAVVLILFTVIPLLVLRTGYYDSPPTVADSSSSSTTTNPSSSSSWSSSSSSSSSSNSNNNNNIQTHPDDVIIEDEERKKEECDIFRGEWVPNPDGPYYTNESCWAIHEHQNCMKYGRPDTQFMKWKWKPDGCDLPIFNPHQFLEILRGKSLAFVGDSVARNQMQSLICLLSRVEYPIDQSNSTDELFKRWYYVSHNFTLAIYTSTFLVRAHQDDPGGPSGTGMFGLHIDEPDPSWASHIDPYDYVIISAAHWFYRSLLLFDSSGRLSGCRYCQLPNVTDHPMPYVYRRAFRTAFSAILNRRPAFKGVVYLRTFSPSHFEGGLWNQGGNCLRQKPYRSSEAVLEGMNLDMYMAQVEEFRAARREAKKKGLRFRLMDTTQATLMRPDGHPSRYGHRPEEKVVLYNDCVHWCLPGPIDAWNDFLLEMLRSEGVLMTKEKKEEHQEGFKKRMTRFRLR